MSEADTLTKSVTLTVTEACNLACTYCYESHKSKRAMSLATAQKILDAEMVDAAANGYDHVEFDLFGGEPFLRFDLVKAITEYICAQRYPLPYVVFATTNGTLVHGEVQDWLRAHPCFVCGLSVDGTKAMHDANRCNSFDDIDLDFFLHQYPQQGIKMTVSQQTLSTLADGVIFLQAQGFEVGCNLAYGIDWSAPEHAAALERELHKLIDYYLAHPNAVPCSMLDASIVNVAQPERVYRRFCGSGIDMAAYDVDGNRYPCQFFMPLSIGAEKAAAAQSLTFYDEAIPARLIDPRCLDCAVQPVCPTCYGSNYASTGNIYLHDQNLCRLNKIMLKARAYFKARQWEAGQLSLSHEEEQATLTAILRIQELQI